jgi:hypothetical protein
MCPPSSQPAGGVSDDSDPWVDLRDDLAMFGGANDFFGDPNKNGSSSSNSNGGSSSNSESNRMDTTIATIADDFANTAEHETMFNQEGPNLATIAGDTAVDATMFNPEGPNLATIAGDTAVDATMFTRKRRQAASSSSVVKNMDYKPMGLYAVDDDIPILENVQYIDSSDDDGEDEDEDEDEENDNSVRRNSEDSSGRRKKVKVRQRICRRFL